MQEEIYNYIISVLKANYSTTVGVIGHLKVSCSKLPWSLCISTLRNEGKLIPDSCTLWDCEKLLYQGKLSSQKLKNLIMKASPCRLEITNAQDMENGHGDYVCLSDSCNCKRNCLCKAEHYWEDLLKRRPELDRDTVKLEKPELKSIVTQAWKNGMKEARKEIKHGNIFTRG